MTRSVSQEMTKADAARWLDAGDLRGVATNENGSTPAAVTRVDAPHEVAEPAHGIQTDEPIPVAKLVPDDSACEQIGLQAAQLSAHLRKRHEELDHREAELNSLVARLESDARTARLWLDQHETDIASRNEELDQRERELAARTEAVAKTEEEIARRCGELTEREAGLGKEEREVERRLARLAVVEESQQRRVSVSDVERAEELHRTAEDLDRRQHWLDEAERRLAASQSDAQELCEQLAADRRSFAEQSAALREQTAAERRQALAEIEEKREALQRRAKRVDESSAALRQLRAELRCVHKETLEIRVATEELWARLSGVAPPAALTQSLGQIRAKLADQYRQAQTETNEQRKELEAIRTELAVQYEKLVEQKRLFEQWVAGCEEDCRQQASRLVAREEELHERETILRQQGQRWQVERLRYQLELGRQPSQASVESQPAAAS
jgi:hypothetical protein